MANSRGYDHSTAFNEGRLQVSAIHNLYYAEYGRQDGKPVIFLHGGPGGNTSKANTAFFDPAVYRVVLFDQRGAGRSTPNAELRENNTDHLVNDIETLRQHLQISKWHMVFGGSWGCTLALAYAEAHPSVMASLVLFGVFLAMGTRVSDTMVWQQLFPDEYERFVNFLPESERESPYPAFVKRIVSGSREEQLEACKVWNRWELVATSLALADDAFDKLDDEKWVLAHGRIEAHYFANNLFLEEEQLLRKATKIQHIPTSIIQGRYDAVCPPKAAWDLHKALPQSEIYIMRDSGHTSTDPGNFTKLVEVCDAYGKLDFGP